MNLPCFGTVVMKYISAITPIASNLHGSSLNTVIAVDVSPIKIEYTLQRPGALVERTPIRTSEIVADFSSSYEAQGLYSAPVSKNCKLPRRKIPSTAVEAFLVLSAKLLSVLIDPKAKSLRFLVKHLTMFGFGSTYLGDA